LSGTSVQFDRTHCSDQVGIYRDPEKFFELPSEELVLFEDSNKNLEIAKKNGILDIGIENRFNKGQLTSKIVIFDRSK